ncbi:MAG: hypothetical protein WEA10_06790 [Actinomycetota bacterium]
MEDRAKGEGIMKERLYVTRHPGFVLDGSDIEPPMWIIGEVVAGTIPHWSERYAEQLGHGNTSEVLTRDQLCATEDGRLALESWERGDDRLHRSHEIGEYQRSEEEQVEEAFVLSLPSELRRQRRETMAAVKRN